MSDAQRKHGGLLLMILVIVIWAGVFFFIGKEYIVKKKIQRLDPKADTENCGKTIDGFKVNCTADANSYTIENKKEFTTIVDGKKNMHTIANSVSVEYASEVGTREIGVKPIESSRVVDQKRREIKRVDSPSDIIIKENHAAIPLGNLSKPAVKLISEIAYQPPVINPSDIPKIEDDCQGESSMIDVCRMMLEVHVHEMAVNKNNPLYCESDVLKHRFNKDSCYSEVAKKLNRAEICANIYGQFSRNNCYQDFATQLKRLDICGRIDDHDKRVWCQFNFSPAEEYVSLCEQMHKDRDRQECFLLTAKKLLDPIYCDRQLLVSRKACKDDVAARADVSDACHIFDDYPRRQECYSQRSMNENDPSLCDRIGHSTYEETCYVTFFRAYVNQAVSENRLTACSQLTNSRSQYICVLEMIRRSQDVKVCDSLNDQTSSKLKDRCYKDLDILTRNLKACDQIKDVGIRNDCRAVKGIKH